jgi:hypothetical protein
MAKDEKILAVTCWGWGAVQNVQQPNLHHFDQQIQKDETKNVNLCMKLM